MTAVPKGQKPGRIKPKIKRKNSKREDQEDGFLAWLRGLCCALCGAWPPVVPHHILLGVVRGMGYKAGDRHAIPCCSECHRGIHTPPNREFKQGGLRQRIKWETTFLAKFGIANGRKLAATYRKTYLERGTQ